MPEFTVEIRDQLDRLVIVPPSVKLVVRRYATEAELHHVSAEIGVDVTAADALSTVANWLGFHAVIYDATGTARWWGMITEVTLATGGLEVAADLRTMYNRIKVLYSYSTADADFVGETIWLENADSIARYGIRERIISVSDLNEAQAEAMAARELARSAWPVRTVQPGGEEIGGSIFCTGYLPLLDWRYHQNLAGFEGHGEGNIEIPLGWTLTDTTIGFEPRKTRIHDIDCRLRALTPGTQIEISGSTYNNGPRMVEGGIEIETQFSRGYTIDFELSDDLIDAGDDQLDLLTEGEMILISGSGNNDKYFFLKTANANEATVRPSDVFQESGQNVTITQGHSVEMDAISNTERPGQSVTLQAYGQELGQAFRFAQPYDWTVAEVRLLLRLSGPNTPIDGLELAICADDGGEPGTVLETASLTNIGGLSFNVATWVTFEFLNTTQLVQATDYWLVLSRSGAASSDAYSVTITEDLYPRGTLYHNRIGTWAQRSPAAAMSFEIWGKEDAITQLAAMVEASQFLSGLSSAIQTSVQSYQYQADPELSALDRFRTLLRSGEETGVRWMARTLPGRQVVIDEAPDAGSARKTLGADGVVRYANGVVLAPGELPAGEWLMLNNVPRFGDAGGQDVLFVERAEYDAENRRISIEPAGDDSPFAGMLNR